MRSNHVHPVLLEVIIQSITVVGAVPNEMLGLGLQHGEVETEWDQRDFMMVRGMRADRDGEPMAIDNRQDFHALPALGEAYSLAAALGRRKRGIDEALAFVDRPFVAQGIGQLRKDVPQHLPLTPLLEAAMDGFVVG